MISVRVADVKTFMSELLVRDLFDHFLLSELEIVTSNHFKVSGKLYKEFYSSDELELMQVRDHSFWKEIKPIAFNIIKGSKMPLSMKLVLMLPPPSMQSIVERSNIGLSSSDINGMYLNFIFENGQLICTTGTSVKVFTLDKALDNIWDEMAVSFLKSKDIPVEEL
ncbi:MAG: hypothetical protein GX995_06480 [Clostridiales bacterium]|nr:hypothetical protein [Clostridiales bacterium]